MDKPEVALDNCDEVYDFYLNHQQNRVAAKAAYGFLALKFRPRVTYADGAKEQVRALVRSDSRLVLAVNHLSQRDPYTVAAAASASALRPAIGRTRVLAKDELFLEPKRRERVDLMGGIPVFRGKNHGMRAVNAAGQRMMDVCAERMRRGDDLAIFPEGTCNLEDPTRLQKVGSGIGHIMSRAVKLGVRPVLVYMGISYGPVSGKETRASVYLENPVTEIPEKPADIARLVAAGLQRAVDGAVARY
jgi:1-acyl-sn-glycerol-3-phosphate acyltransferase